MSGGTREYGGQRMSRRYAIRVTVLYALIAGAWIALSDPLLFGLGLSSEELSRISLIKGLGFVAVTATVLYVAVTRGVSRFAEVNDRLSAIIEVAPIPIVALDTQGKVLLWNPAAERTFGWMAEEVLGERNPIVPPEEWDSFRSAQKQMLDSPSGSSIEVTRRKKDGSPIELRVYNAAMHDAGGRVVGTMGVLQDITGHNATMAEVRRYRDHLEELVEARTEELSAANRELERATKAKDTFLTGMSHELRTPLNSIIGFTQMLLQGLAGPLNEEQAKQLEMVRGSGRHLLSLVDDVLDFSVAGADRMVLDFRPVAVADVLDSVEGQIRPMIDEKGLSWSCDCEVGAEIYTDPRRLEQILLSLLSNAVKFTERGTVRLEARVSGSTAYFMVSDTGVGIDERDVELIFQDFVQIETPDAIKPDGAGLGLALSRRLARMLGGSVSVRSVPGEGSTFTLALPVDGAQNGSGAAATVAAPSRDAR